MGTGGIGKGHSGNCLIVTLISEVRFSSLSSTEAVFPTPTLANFVSGPSPVCAGSPISFTATGGNVTGTYDFTLMNGSSPLSGTANTALFSQVVTASGSGVQNFTLIVRDNEQSARATTSVMVNSLPTVGLTNTGPLSCAVTSVTLTASGGTTGETFSYTFANGSGVLDTPGASNTLVANSTGTYSVAVANASGCVSTTSTTVINATGTVSVSSAFSQSFTASEGTEAYSYSLASNSLPTV